MKNHFKLKKLAFLFFIMLASCSTTKKEEPYQYLSYNCPAIVLPQRHRLPIKSLTYNSTPDEVVKSYVASVKILSDWQNTAIRQVESSR